jgi:hypothetical protein
MHPNLRLLICRSGFLLFALLPTLVVGGWIIRRGMPEYVLAQQAEWERELSQRLGLSVTVSRLAYPHPGVARLSGVQLANPETGEVVATVREVEVTQNGDTFAVELSQPTLHVDQLAHVGRTLHERLLQNASASGMSCELVAADVTLQSPTSAITLPELLGVFGQAPTGDPAIDLEFSLVAGADSSQRGTLSIVRNRGVRPPETRWQLDTAGAPLPCSLAAEAIPELRKLGRDAQFAGAAVWVLTSGGLHGEVTGRLTDVDLDALVSEQLLHQLSGRAVVTLQPARMEKGQLQELRGSLQAMDGWISPSLLVAAGEHLGLELRPDLPLDSPRPIPFRQMSLGFLLSDRTLQLTGDCDATRPGVALANAAGPIAEVPPNHVTASVSLLRTLLPESDWQVPATRQTGTLASFLPVPDLTPEVTAQRSAHTPTRLGPASTSAEGPVVRQPR